RAVGEINRDRVVLHGGDRMQRSAYRVVWGDGQQIHPVHTGLPRIERLRRSRIEYGWIAVALASAATVYVTEHPAMHRMRAQTIARDGCVGAGGRIEIAVQQANHRRTVRRRRRVEREWINVFVPRRE